MMTDVGVHKNIWLTPKIRIINSVAWIYWYLLKIGQWGSIFPKNGGWEGVRSDLSGRCTQKIDFFNKKFSSLSLLMYPLAWSFFKFFLESSSSSEHGRIFINHFYHYFLDNFCREKYGTLRPKCYPHHSLIFGLPSSNFSSFLATIHSRSKEKLWCSRILEFDSSKKWAKPSLFHCLVPSHAWHLAGFALPPSRYSPEFHKYLFIF